MIQVKWELEGSDIDEVAAEAAVQRFSPTTRRRLPAAPARLTEESPGWRCADGRWQA